jgi:hypothetical protein
VPGSALVAGRAFFARTTTGRIPLGKSLSAGDVMFHDMTKVNRIELARSKMATLWLTREVALCGEIDAINPNEACGPRRCDVRRPA